MYQVWTAQVIGTYVNERFTGRNPNAAREWLWNQIHEAYYYEEGPDALGAALAQAELEAHDFDVCGDFTFDIGDVTVRICADLEDEDEEEDEDEDVV